MERKIEINFEDRDLLVLEKPPGWVTTKEGRIGKLPTVEDWMEQYCKNDLPRNGIVHRLDKGTSGLLLAAKSEKAFVGLSQQFKKRSIKKIYWALAGGDLPFEGEVVAPIGRLRHTFGKYGVSIDGKRAETGFKLLKKINIEGRIYSLIEIVLKTGRTHQIRAHFAYLRWPLMGDRTYGGSGNLDRPFLHAKRISLMHPVSGGQMNFESELCDDLRVILNKYEKI